VDGDVTRRLVPHCNDAEPTAAEARELMIDERATEQHIGGTAR